MSTDSTAALKYSLKWWTHSLQTPALHVQLPNTLEENEVTSHDWHLACLQLAGWLECSLPGLSRDEL